MALRQLHGQFGSMVYDSGNVYAGASITVNPGFPIVLPNNSLPYGVDLRHDTLLESSVGAVLNGNIHFGSYQKVDLRDMFNDRECMDNLVINTQRTTENPIPTYWVNMGLGPIIETIAIINDDIDCRPGRSAWNALSGGSWHNVGFDKVADNDGIYSNVLYRENRRYVPNTGQVYRSLVDMASNAGVTAPPGGENFDNNMWLTSYTMESRTVGGYPSRLIGPFLTIVRVWSIYAGDRSDRALKGNNAGDAEALNWSGAEGQIQLTITPMQWNIVGNRRAMTDEEIALDYSQRLINT